MPASPPAAAFLRNSPTAPANLSIRPQMRDLPMENIAELAMKASQLEGVIPLWYGEGDLVTPPFIRDASKRALDGGLTFYIPNMRGYGPLVDELASYQSRLHGVPIGADRSTVTPGGMQALLVAMSLILDPGQNAVYLEPQWPNIANIIHLVGGIPRPVPLAEVDGNLTLDMATVKAACDARTRAIVFSSPANPTGWVASRENLADLLAFSRERGIWIVADEVYSRLYFDGAAAPSILSLAGPEDLVLTVNSFSKAWAMTGWRVGWLTHPASVAEHLGAMTQYMNSGTAGIMQAGALAALREGEPLVETMRERCRAGIDMAYAALGRIPDIVLPNKPRGGMYVFFQVKSEPNSRRACMKVLEKTRVGLAPGALFGASAEGHVRMCICRDPEQLKLAFDRMIEVFA